MAALDPSRAAAFGAQMRRVLNDSMLGLLISVGQRTRLFEAMSAAGSATSADIARAAGLDERDVRDWLGAMVTGGVVEHDGKRGLYLLPAEHAAWLSADHLATLTRGLAVLGAAGNALAEHGGAMPPAAMARVRALEAEASAARLDACLVTGILPLAPGLPARLAAGIDVLDLGGGHAATLIAAAFSHSRVTTALPAAGCDLVIALDGAIDPPDAILLARTALRPGGVFIACGLSASSHLADNLDHPLGPALYGVAALRRGALWGQERAREAILAAGFADLEVQRLERDPVHNYYFASAPR